MNEAPKRRATWPASLERRLPLMIGGLLFASVSVFGAAAYREVRNSAHESAETRVETVAKAIREAFGGGMSRRARALDQLSSRREIITALHSDSGVADSVVREVFARLRTPADTLLLSHELRSADGRVIVREDIESTTLSDESAIHRLIAGLDTASFKIGAFYQVGSEIRYWIVSAIDEGSQRTGFLAERRVLRTTGRTEDQIRDLTGQNVDIYFTTRAGDVWATMEGQPVARPFTLPESAGLFHAAIAGVQTLAFSSDIPDTQWRIVYAIPESTISERALILVRRVTPFALSLLALSALAAWLVSRQVTKPLRGLVEAANAIADENFSKRVPQPRDEELRQLADAFNRMAERLGESHREMEARNEELRAAQQSAVVARNISEVARIEAQRANDAKTTFLAMMSHELRTPLSAIGGYTEIMQLGLRGELNEAQLSDLERIRANQQHLLTIINDMLDLSQIESGQLSVSCENVSLDDVFAEVEPVVAPHMAKKRLSYQVDPSLRLLSVHADRERLRQVLVNLLSNASRFSDIGGVISVHATVRNGRVSLHVSDSGIGIPADKLKAIFEPFVQVDTGPTRRAGGTGLGLPISRKLAEAMDGKLEVSSEVGVGSTFTLDLRAADTSVHHKAELRLIHSRRKQIA